MFFAIRYILLALVNLSEYSQIHTVLSFYILVLIISKCILTHSRICLILSFAVMFVKFLTNSYSVDQDQTAPLRAV